MSCLLIFRAKIIDRESFKRYASRVDETLAPFGGETRVRARFVESIDGDSDDRTVLACIAFPDHARARAWYASDAYRALMQDREAGIEVDVSLFDSIEFQVE